MIVFAALNSYNENNNRSIPLAKLPISYWQCVRYTQRGTNDRW